MTSHLKCTARKCYRMIHTCPGLPDGLRRWHAAHFALWGRIELLERSLPWYESILPMAEATARLQGYEGARWPGARGEMGSGDAGAVEAARPRRDIRWN